MSNNRSMQAKRIKYIKQSKARPRFLQMNYGQIKVKQSVDRSKIPKEYLALFAYRDHAKVDVLEDFLDAKFPSASADRPAQSLTLRHIICVETRYIKTLMFFDAEENCFFFTEFQTLIGLLRKSVTYNNRERAIRCFDQQTIRWKESIQVPNVE